MNRSEKATRTAEVNRQANGVCLPCMKMPVPVFTYLMPFLQNPIDQFRNTLGPLAYNEKSGSYVRLQQTIKYKGGEFRMRTVIECQACAPTAFYPSAEAIAEYRLNTLKQYNVTNKKNQKQ
jgi:hypothetical protein